MQRRIPHGLAALSLVVASSLAAAADHATPREARALFDQAVSYLKANGPDKSWKAFNNRTGPFVKKDLYVYVIDNKGTYIANGAAPRSAGWLRIFNEVPVVLLLGILVLVYVRPI